VLPSELPSLKQREDVEQALVTLKEAISSDLCSTWQYNRKQGRYEEINILRETTKYSEPNPVIILL
jgi:hypothetical protein